jgi:hypothetical protein
MGGGGNADMGIGHRFAVRRVEGAPAGSEEIYLRPGVEMSLFALQLAFLVATDEACGDAFGTATIDKEYRQIAAGPTSRG